MQGEQLTVPVKLNKDAETMTENAESPESTSRMIEAELANQNKVLIRNPTDVKSKTCVSTDVSLVNTNTVLPSGDKIIRGFQSVAVENIESVSDLSQHNKRLGDIFEEENNGDGNSDSGSLIEDQYDPNENNKDNSFVEDINLTQPKLASGLVSRAERYRKRSVAQFMRDDHYEFIDFKVKTKTTQSKPLKIKVGQAHPEEKKNSDRNIMETEAKMKPVKIFQVPAREKDKIFDIYVSGQRMLHSVKELKGRDLETGVNTSKNESNGTENMCGTKSIHSHNIRNSKLRLLHGIESINTKQISFVAIGSTKAGFYVNFKDFPKQEIKPMKLEEVDEPKVISKPLDIKQSSDGRYICPNCGKHFERKEAASWHMRIVHLGQSKFKCEVCGKLFPSPSGLRRHTVSHIRKKDIGDTPFICEICLETFPGKQCLKDHMMNHNKFVCEMCGKSFRYKRNYESHRRTHELKDVVPSFQCPDPGCGRLFKTRERLDKHLVYKRAEQNFVCDICGFKTKMKQKLEQHVWRKHTENRKSEYFCEQCSKYFYSKQNYTVHMENHQGLSRYVCHCCNMAFAGSSTLQRHYRRKAGLYVKPKSKNIKSR